MLSYYNSFEGYNLHSSFLPKEILKIKKDTSKIMMKVVFVVFKGLYGTIKGISLSGMKEELLL